jgi:hypothetical protein
LCRRSFWLKIDLFHNGISTMALRGTKMQPELGIKQPTRTRHHFDEGRKTHTAQR